MIQTITHKQQQPNASAPKSGFKAYPTGINTTPAPFNSQSSLNKPVTTVAPARVLLPLRKIENTSYSLHIPASVESKIRYLCSTFPNNEWSGVLFYSVSGSFENGDLSLTCVDIYPMNIGSATFTEYSDSDTADIASYIAQHEELMQPTVYEALVHSHDTMTAFFSGTDLNTLAREGEDRNHFLSLIVNNAGSYVAAITRLVSSSTDTTGTLSVTTSSQYKSWNNKVVTLQSAQKSKKTVNDHKEEKIIEYYPLTIVKDDAVSFSELDTRLSEIRTPKATAAVPQSQIPSVGPHHPFFNESLKKPSTSSYRDPYGDYDDFDDIYGSPYNDYDKYQNFFDDTPNDIEAYSSKPVSHVVSSAASSSEPDSTLVDNLICKILSGDILNESIFIGTYANNHDDLDEAYSRLFDCDVEVESDSNEYKDFTSWIDVIVDYVLYLPNDFYRFATDEINFDSLVSTIASAMISRLQPYMASYVVQIVAESLDRYVSNK